LDAASAGALGQISQRLTPRGQSIQDFIVDQAGPPLSAGHDKAAIVSQRPQAAEHSRADGGTIFLHEERAPAGAGQAGFHGAVVAAGLGMTEQG
jgi:hypothetical protein